jgi:hypothetical protein
MAHKCIDIAIRHCAASFAPTGGECCINERWGDGARTGLLTTLRLARQYTFLGVTPGTAGVEYSAGWIVVVAKPYPRSQLLGASLQHPRCGYRCEDRARFGTDQGDPVLPCQLHVEEIAGVSAQVGQTRRSPAHFPRTISSQRTGRSGCAATLAVRTPRSTAARPGRGALVVSRSHKPSRARSGNGLPHIAIRSASLLPGTSSPVATLPCR